MGGDFLARKYYVVPESLRVEVEIGMQTQTFSFALQCNPTWMRGNFGLKLQNSLTYMLDFIIMKVSRVNHEKGY